MFDEDKAGKTFDLCVEQFGVAPPEGRLFDSRVLMPRESVPYLVEKESGHELSLEQLDDMERRRFFSWTRGSADEGGDDRGVPMYVPYRIGLCHTLVSRGWADSEIVEFAGWEDWMVDDMMADPRFAYQDDDVKVVLNHKEDELQQIIDERTRRLPADDRPAGWASTGWSSEHASLSEEELSTRIARLEQSVAWLRSVKLENVTEAARRRIQRQAYQLREHYEMVRFVSIARDRIPIEAGFSPCVCFTGPQKLFSRPEDFEALGRVDWASTLDRATGVAEDPEGFPIRLPGLLCVGGRVILEAPLAPAEYERRFLLFHLEVYPSAYRHIVSDRRCAHCGRPLLAQAHERRLYCSEGCSAARRQKVHRERQKAAILRRRF